MRVLGIDPGSTKTGYGILEENGTSFQSIDYGLIRTAAVGLPDQLKTIFDRIVALIDQYHPDVLVVEEPFVSHNNKMALKIGQVRGVAVLAGINARLEIKSYSPLQIKQAVVGYGRAAKEQVQQMVKSLLHLDSVPKPADAADALAAAICYLNTVDWVRRGRE